MLEPDVCTYCALFLDEVWFGYLVRPRYGRRPRCVLGLSCISFLCLFITVSDSVYSIPDRE